MADLDETLAELRSDHSNEASGIFATVHIFNHVLNRLLSKDTRIPGITGVNSRIILYVAHQEKLGKPVYQSDVKAHFGITRSTCSRVLGLMESKGLIQRTKPEADGRKSELHLTDSSRRSVSHIMESARKIEERVLQGGGPPRPGSQLQGLQPHDGQHRPSGERPRGLRGFGESGKPQETGGFAVLKTGVKFQSRKGSPWRINSPLTTCRPSPARTLRVSLESKNAWKRRPPIPMGTTPAVLRRISASCSKACANSPRRTG